VVVVSLVHIFSYSKFRLQDDNRYNSGRGAHLNLKRAEKARIQVNKIPGAFFLKI
jgi:hypothetical protein